MLNLMKKRLMPGMMAALIGCLSLASCDLVNDESDCVTSYNLVKFKYDYNMKYADAFDHEVKQVSLLAFGSDGKLYKRIDMPADKLNDNNEMVLEVEPGTYDLLVWAGEHSKSFDIAVGTVGQSTLTDFHAYMHRTEGNVSKDDLAPLWHRLYHVDLPYASPSKPNKVEIPLVKDTNVVRVVLQHISGYPVDHRDFNFTITDGNGWLEADNSIRSTDPIYYHPWFLESGSVDINTSPEDAPDNPRSAADYLPAGSRALLTGSVAEFTVNRLMDNHAPILHITRPDGSTVLRINLRDYIMLVKGYYNRDMSNQEYLDREDEYNLTFFLDEGNRWLSAVIIINNWRIVRHDVPLE